MSNMLLDYQELTGLESAPGFNYSGTEDCLFLSVYAPQNQTNLPVFVWIRKLDLFALYRIHASSHRDIYTRLVNLNVIRSLIKADGGGYGAGQGSDDLSMIVNTNNNSFIGVAIQYRLGAFGFMSSDEIHRYGVVNAGLLDQTLALQWVQSYIHLFGGNASQVTIGGISAGAGSVMLQAMAFGGNVGESLFSNAIPASPYLPQQFGYADFVPSQSYYAFAAAVGCFKGFAQGNPSESIFNCLISKDTDTLQNASAYISGSGRYGTWAFLPVTDGSFIQQLPSQQLLEKRVNGRRILSGNNANEGPLFTPQNIVTEDDFINFLRTSFPLFTEDDISRVLLYYPSTNASVSSELPEFATSGSSGATALNQSTFGTGQQQRANNVYSETTFVCPSYWLAEAFTNNGRTAWKYQYSVIPGQHGADYGAYLGPAASNQGPDFVKAFMTIYGNFITQNDPSIPADIAAGASAAFPAPSNTSAAATDPKPSEPDAVVSWPPYTLAAPYHLNLNQSGGVPFEAPAYPGSATGLDNVTQFSDPGLHNHFTLVNAYTWEGGRVKDDPKLTALFDALASNIQRAATIETSPWNTNITSFSISVTSASETLWTTSHTAPIVGHYVDSPPTNVTDQTYFRIASISKVFTVLAALLQQKEGKWSLKDPVTEWLPELRNHSGDGPSDLADPFEDRQYGFERPVEMGLPPLPDEDMPPCGRNRPGERPCTRKEILDGLIKRPPLFEPNSRATYSNMNFVLLGLALESVTGLNYDEIVNQTIFQPLSMHHWTYGPTGGIYTTTSDLSTFARAILNHALLDTSTTNAWFNPRSSSPSYSFAYGMPWEIFRTSSLLPSSNRIQTLVTKAGGLRGYTSQFLLLPEYDLAITVLVAGDGHALAWLREEVLKALIPAVEDITRQQTSARLSGTYTAAAANNTINSSLTLSMQPPPSGLTITSWLSNGTDFLALYRSMSQSASRQPSPGKVQLTPTRTKRGDNGEVWRAQFVLDEFDRGEGGVVDMRLVTDVDTFTYAAKSVEEFVFWIGEGGVAEGVALPGLRVEL
ncbi:MAG: hypothetical protein Q9184_007029, partial [Pyrenodesmia sp. 2 TL-2023]